MVWFVLRLYVLLEIIFTAEELRHARVEFFFNYYFCFWFMLTVLPCLMMNMLFGSS